MPSITKKQFKGILTVVAVLLILATSVGAHQRDGSKLETVFLDVGQGDAILIKTGDGQNILVDGGPNQSVIYGLGRHLAFYERTLDLVILTHPDADHVVGLIDVLKRYRVKKVLLTVARTQAPEFPVWQQTLAAEGAEVILASAGQVFSFGGEAEQAGNQTSTGGALTSEQAAASDEQVPQTKITILYPFKETDIVGLPVNDTSIVARLDHGENSWLLTGDLPTDIEEEMLAREHSLLDTDILKVGHHGSKYSSSAPFLQAVTPEMAVISVGVDNRFGHPAYAALERLRQSGAEIWRTDQEGDICLVSDGEKVAECP